MTNDNPQLMNNDNMLVIGQKVNLIYLIFYLIMDVYLWIFFSSTLKKTTFTLNIKKYESYFNNVYKVLGKGQNTQL
jgi:hypothetical protein